MSEQKWFRKKSVEIEAVRWDGGAGAVTAWFCARVS